MTEKTRKIENDITCDLPRLGKDEVTALRAAWRQRLSDTTDTLFSEQSKKPAEKTKKAFSRYLTALSLTHKDGGKKSLKERRLPLFAPARDIQKMSRKLAATPFYPQDRTTIKENAKSRFAKNGHDPIGKRVRLYFKLETQDSASETEIAITNHLAFNGRFEITDYIKGYAKSGKQIYKIGKLLEQHGREDLAKAFRDDPKRHGRQTQDTQYIVLTNYVSDTLYMSMRRNWISCMDLDREYGHRLPDDIKGGAFMAYLIREDDPKIMDPLARIRLLRYQCGKKTMYHAGGYYGVVNKAFEQAVDQLAESLSDDDIAPTDIFRLDPSVYRDRAPMMLASQETIRQMPIEDFLNTHTCSHYEEDDGTLVIQGNVILSNMNMGALPDMSHVVLKGNLFINGNNLTSLHGMPKVVTGCINAEENPLETLEGCPKIIGRELTCSNTRLKNLKGAPEALETLTIKNNTCDMVLEGFPRTFDRISINGETYTQATVNPDTLEKPRIRCTPAPKR